ncbi:MAG: flagellar biosynthetic protein FliO [Hyphomicrobiales bacterium]
MPEMEIWQIAAIAVGAIVVLFLLIWLLKRAGGAISARRGDRLAVLETRSIDKIRHLVLIQCDEEEHLLLVGGPQDLVVKTNVGQDVYETVEYQQPAYETPAAPVEPTFDLPAETPAPNTDGAERRPSREGFRSRFSSAASSSDTSASTSRFASRDSLASGTTSAAPSLKRETPRPTLSGGSITRQSDET